MITMTDPDHCQRSNCISIVGAVQQLVTRLGDSTHARKLLDTSWSLLLDLDSRNLQGSADIPDRAAHNQLVLVQVRQRGRLFVP